LKAIKEEVVNQFGNLAALVWTLPYHKYHL